MSYTLVTAPTAFPVTLEETKIFLRLNDISLEDSFINLLIQAATRSAEIYTQRRFITQTWKYSLDVFPNKMKPGGFWPGVIMLPYPPCQSVTSVKYYDSQGTQRTLQANTDYVVESDSEPTRIVPAPNRVWPATQTDRTNCVEIIFVCGYGADGTFVDPMIKQAILLTVAHFYENRGELIDLNLKTAPKTSEWLLMPFRDLRY